MHYRHDEKQRGGDRHIGFSAQSAAFPPRTQQPPTVAYGYELFDASLPPGGHPAMDQQEYARTSAAFLRFADEEARHRSALYDELARGTASDPLVIAFLLTLPKEKRQPNLLFAATRLLTGTPSGWCQF